MRKNIIKPMAYRIFFDFDNTITHFDTLDDIIERFAINKDWVRIEEQWKKGVIGSRQCLQLQLGLVRITRPVLMRYLSRIKIDPYFRKITALLAKKKIKPVILSDNFSFIIKHILSNNGFKGIKVYCNRLKFDKDRIRTYFPYSNSSCPRCGHCKKINLLGNSSGDKIIYIGDGLSDICPAQYSDIVFAKGSLLEDLKKKKKPYIKFEDLSSVYNYLKEAL